ncbi:hypothetical protein [Streptosporangium sp. KLBMP 9127]|nr:hypothetical protein [Streptosporangium sp. KLBMP 9127]
MAAFAGQRQGIDRTSELRATRLSLANRAELILIIVIRRAGLRTEALSTRCGRLAVIDLLFIAPAFAYSNWSATTPAARRAVAPREERT